MQTKEYRTVDKSEWDDGEWKNEPDKAQWQDEATGLPCLIVRGPAGALCGYVGVPEGHRWYGKGYGAIDAEIEVHGGLTFADKCADIGDESRHVCHVPDPGEPDHVWWFGFDAAHAGDVTPAYSYGRMSEYESYKSIVYVRNHVTRLAAQLA